MTQRSHSNPSYAQHPILRVVDALHAAGCKPKGKENKWQALCPAHEDSSPSLSVGIGDDGKVLMKCHAGCRLEDVCFKLDMKVADLFSGESDSVNRAPKPNPWKVKSNQFKDNLTTERSEALSKALQLPTEALAAFPYLGWSLEGCWTFEECDGNQNVIGILRRFESGEKKALSGSKRGLIIPFGYQSRTGPLFLPEGPSDVMAIHYAGLKSIGRPSNTGGVEHLVELLKSFPSDETIIVVGENDQKDDGSWPGRAGAIKVATELANGLQRVVKWALPPSGIKDCRDWLIATSEQRQVQPWDFAFPK